MLKKTTWFALVLSAVLLIAGCGSKNEGNGNNANANSGAGEQTENTAAGTNAADEKTYSIAISQIVEHPSLDATREGFLAALKDGGLIEGENLKVDYQNAQNDQTNNTTIAQKIASDKPDLALGIATPSAQALVKNIKDSPVLFAAVTDPVASKIVDNLDQPGGNVTGASDTNPEATTKLVGFIADNFPNVKKVGLIINEGETNAVIMAKKAEEEFGKKGIELVKAAVTNTSEVQQAAESLIGRVDAFYITLDNVVVTGADAILKIAKKEKLPFFSSDRDTVEKGAFATVGFKYYDHGYQVGQMAVDVLKNGKNPGEMKVMMQEKLDLIINAKVAADYGIELTDAMKSAVADQAENLIQ
ncbi:ABC transporter substrate-binding protein [Paenibacillus aurantiacus]|uniref:ABC transporter substrate-binding protein n=1 Tax=Paenibacillus aurantiacus TaxID=1936118 RepID=A0ABV5KNJ0_9BACL